MKKTVHCPWCGAEMNFTMSLTSKRLSGGRYMCSNPNCRAMSPFALAAHKDKFNIRQLKQKTRAAALRRAKRPLRSIPLKKICSTELLIPCWLEVREKMYARPVLLDHDSVGFFAKYENRGKKETEYYMAEDYNRKWRCWRRDPSIIEIKDAPWEDEIEKA